ncbi:oligosaccharide flippase family protein [Pseudorhodoferax sp. Leaf267]|uniref:oligosaccharide flippase family protein n=1 Tax=Pseudorhodoferax sp. Leaf267 TaxID=1736316 RepID=UPI0006F1D109|nr:oligosaccharide flippase family protein [Pseudorhodoferax sp. Leaf267]KQP23137.1 hypothetical protein ASF43_04445 [Pseudorhodoferax sp. Leaf267]
MRKAIFINFASTTGSTAVQFIVSVLIARLLTPAEIGIYSITIVLVNIAHVFRDFGVVSYLQREADLTNEKIRSAMGVLYASTWLIALIIFLASGWVAGYFGYPEVKPVMQVLAIGFVFIPFSSVMVALLTRELQAVKLAWANLVGTSAYATASLSLAYMGFGTMSLAWANLANLVATGLLYIPMRPRGLPWLPGFHRWRRVVKFGVGALMTNGLNAINTALPDLLLGKMGSAHQVGLVSRANSTVSIFTYVAGSAVNFGSLSYIAKAHHRGESLEPLLVRATALLTGVGWPALALTSLLGHQLVEVLYGQNWLESVPAIPALALAAAIGLLFNYSSIALTAINRPYLAALPVAAAIIARIVLAVAFFSGDIARFTWLLLAATVFTVPFHLYLQTRYLHLPWRSVLKSCQGSFGVTLAVGVCCKLLLLATSAYALSPLATLVAISCAMVPVWLGAVVLLDHPIKQELQVLAKNLPGRRFLSRR